MRHYDMTKRLQDLRFVDGVQVTPLKEGHRERLIGGLNGVLPQAHLEAIWNIIWSRWCHFQGVAR